MLTMFVFQCDNFIGVYYTFLLYLGNVKRLLYRFPNKKENLSVSLSLILFLSIPMSGLYWVRGHSSARNDQSLH